MANKGRGTTPVHHAGSGGSGGNGGGGGRNDDPGTDSPTDSPSTGGGGSGGGLTPAQARARAADRWVDAAKRLEAQARAWKYVLGKHGAIAELRTELKNQQKYFRQQDQAYMEDYRARMGSFKEMADDNENAAGAATLAAMTNAGRERASALSEAMAQGAGETDALLAQGMALRNWSANQQEISRNFADTETSINASITDLTADVRTSRINNARALMQARESQWAEYYDQISEAKTNLGNTYGQAADYYGYANEQDPSKRLRQQEKDAQQQSTKYLSGAARQTGKAWESPGIPKRILKWDGQGPVDSRFNNQMFDRPTVTDLARPEGATLRSWT